MQLFEASDVTMGGVLLPDSAKEKPIAGEVVSVGPGKREEDGSRKSPQVNALLNQLSMMLTVFRKEVKASQDQGLWRRMSDNTV